MKHQAVVVAGIANDGTMYDVHMLQSCGDAQLDFDCVQAVMGASGSCPTNTDDASLDHHCFAFNEDTKPERNVSGIAAFFRDHPERQGARFAYYRIPLDVMHRYRGLFTEDELLGDENVGYLATTAANPELPDWAIGQLQHIYQAQWCSFFRKHPKATKRQIEKLRDQLLFDERHPVRQ
jgi:hypothetical protein